MMWEGHDGRGHDVGGVMMGGVMMGGAMMWKVSWLRCYYVQEIAIMRYFTVVESITGHSMLQMGVVTLCSASGCGHSMQCKWVWSWYAVQIGVAMVSSASGWSWMM